MRPAFVDTPGRSLLNRASWGFSRRSSLVRASQRLVGPYVQAFVVMVS